MILKFINGKNRELSQLKNVIDYVRDSSKTKPKLMGGYCCDKEYPFKDMSVFKQLYNKASGKQYEHFVVSFDPEDEVDSETALNVVSSIARINGNFQSFYALHTDTDHLHAHIVMNSVGRDGTKFRQWKPQLRDFKDCVNAICYNNGIEPVKGTIGSKPVDDLDLLEFTHKELESGGFTMNNNEYYDYLPTESEYERYDINNYDYDDYGNDNINRTGLFIGNRYKITADSEKAVEDLIQSCEKNRKITPQKVKVMMKYFGDGIDYHIGDAFDITISGNTPPVIEVQHIEKIDSSDESNIDFTL